MHTLLVARTVRGLEPLVAEEIGGAVRHRHREVWFRRTVPDAGVLGLRTADDVLLAAAVAGRIGHTKAALTRLRAAAREVDAAAVVALKAAFGGSPEVKGVDVSASFLGRRTFTRYDIEDAVGAELAGRLGVPYHSRRHGPPPPCTLSWRVSVEGDEAVIGLRIADRPLHRRPYKIATVPGTLHPPVAAAMARLAGLERARSVLDPCCGAGTTLIEARASAPSPRYLGADLSPEAVRVAAGNTADADRIGWLVADAGRVPLPAGSVDVVLVNPPWERQVAAGGLLSADHDRLWRELRRVLTPQGRVVALLPDAVEPPGFAVDRAIRLSLMGRHPAIAVLSPPARRGSGR
ncbi:methyltransferase domain-containing protein [Nonomuraea sp. NPDC049152]|uniref:methyltransferase domain-containing protein n=1 Tax=Nonomuraea sp. NPDC049152 TaxID=3154350 RepID=UPI0033CFE5B8